MFAVVELSTKAIWRCLPTEEAAFKWAKDKKKENYMVVEGKNLTEIFDKVENEAPTVVTPQKKAFLKDKSSDGTKQGFADIVIDLKRKKSQVSADGKPQANSFLSGNRGHADILKKLNGRSTQFVVTLFKKNEKQDMVVTIDLMEISTKETHWVHKPEFWEFIFQEDLNTPVSSTNGQLHSFFHQFQAGHRRATEGGPNVIGEFVTPKTKSKIFRWLLYAVIPKTVSKEIISKLLQDFGTMAEDKDFQNIYSQCLESKSSNKAALEAVAPSSGKYWSTLSAATTNIRFIECDCLNAQLMDDAIHACVNSIYDCNIPVSMWTSDMKKYAGY